MNINEEYKVERERYMSKAITHQEFYTWLNEKIGLDMSNLVMLDSISPSRIMASKDPHFNDIPLELWENRHHLVRNKASRAGLKSWSMSGSVCCLKALARNFVNEVNNEN